MAIIPDVPHVSVDIVVDGHALPEYLDEDDGDSVSSDSIIKYVECVSGSKFGIRTDITGMEPWDLERGDAILEHYYLDGKRVDGCIKQFPLVKHHARSVLHGARHREGGMWKERKFMFADLVTSEDAIVSKRKPELKDLGTITVKLFYAQVSVREKRRKSHHDSKKVSVGHKDVHEKHLKGKAMSHQTKLGEEVIIGNLTPVEAHRLGEAFAVFSFRYRSHRNLQTLCLIPRSPSPVPLEERPEESLNRAELLEILRRQKARQEEQVAIKTELKRERAEDVESDDDLVVISSRRPAKTFKSSVNISTGVETIDLTDD